MTHEALAARVLALRYFQRVSRADFDCLVAHLLETEQLQTTDEGGLIVGLAGERQTSSFKFFAVFQENVEYSCRWENQELGTLCMPPPPGEKIAIAGRVWVVEEVDHKRHLLYCTPIPGKVPAYFGECPGDIHTRILLKMRDVLAEGRQYPSLLKNAVVRLAEARAAARASGMLDRPLVNLGGDLWVLFPWLGTYAFLALERLLKRRCAGRLGLSGLDSSRPYYLQFHAKVSARDFYRILQEEAAVDFDPMELVYPGEVPLFEKYDPFLPPELVRKGFAYGILDLATLRQRIREWTAAGFAEHD
jgi:ATP-dependent Lhr-like helicase